jgi:transcriptional regulator with XRE-family HTH domain
MSNNIQALLDKTGRSQAYLCRELGRSANTVSSWCRGKSEPTLSDAKLIANALEVSIDALIDDNNNDKKESK